MKKPNAIIFSGYGLNTEAETKNALERLGAHAEIVHINDIITKPSLLNVFQIAVMPGGFSYGDDTGSGKAYGNRLRGHLGSAIEKFLSRDTLMIGICNGFQILTSAGLLPGALLANETPRYLTRWVDLKVVDTSPWLTGIETMSVPIAHGEGKYYAPAKTLATLKKENAIAFEYVEGPIANHFGLPANPNGSLENIAGVTAYNGRLLGMMPHPERAIRFTQLPHWTLLKERYRRDGVPMPSEASGLQLFRNAVNYFV